MCKDKGKMNIFNLTGDVENDQRRPDKALHQTAYRLRLGRKPPSLCLPAAGEFGRWPGTRNILP